MESDLDAGIGSPSDAESNVEVTPRGRQPYRETPSRGDGANAYNGSGDEDWQPSDGSEGIVTSGSESGVTERTAQRLKRPAEDDKVPRPFKRQKGAFNGDYLDLLNREIEDAAHRVTLEDQDNMETSQIGLTVWSPLEKKLLFEGISRLGRDDLPGITLRLGTKSEVEVMHYINALQTAQTFRLNNLRRTAVEYAEYPAATELSQQCCHALEEAADAISTRQERREQQREESLWGPNWDITAATVKAFANHQTDDDGVIAAAHREIPSVSFFDAPRWLKLSRHIFMNSAIPGNNWTQVDSNPPSIWATALEDFYSVAVSVTRRLVQATLFASATRIRAKQHRDARYTSVIRKEDALAAIESLGLPVNSQKFWRDSARRLRLDVVDDAYDSVESSQDLGPMSFDDVERSLSQGDVDPPTAKRTDSDTRGHEEVSESGSDGPGSADSSDQESLDEEQVTVAAEVEEVFRFSLPDFPETRRSKQALEFRITTERQQERHADQVDAYLSYREETEMWDILQKQPPIEMPKRIDPGPPQKSLRDVESIFPLGKDWRDNTQYRGDWEMPINQA
ncbi:hypothetical protein N3K66_002004 [Trichothecium roseum]|uniref:Uncharacterized protein n=1 Tax=Trichothecium roseum TaxID=47278 RepID=A0ACC0V8C3_9HYPO|nr:hypothetical protein N3K66_002004 [Trichothecium roseum]